MPGSRTTLRHYPLTLVIGLLVAFAPRVAAQSNAQTNGRTASGRIAGRIVDAETGQGLAGAAIRVLEAGQAGAGTISGPDGRYVLRPVTSGTVALRVENLGYATKVIRDVIVPADGVVVQNVALDPSAIELETIEISAGAERGSVNRALDRQRTAAAIVNAVSAEQISRSPDSDAAAALQRVSGVTVQDGRFVHVRGLGERYTTASLNGARIPSPEPERRIVPLDLFPAGLLQSITTSKTFTPDQPGDFSGAQVDIRTREYPTGRTLAGSLSFGYNDRATGRRLPLAPPGGMNALGFGARDRRLPASLREAGRLTNPPSQAEINRMLGGLRNVWSIREGAAEPSGSAAISSGGRGDVLGRPIGYLISATYARSEEARQDVTRAQALAGPGGSTTPINRFQGATGSARVRWGTLANLSTLLGAHTRLSLNATYNRTADEDAHSELGYSEEFNLPLRIERLQLIERSVWSGMLEGEHELGGRHRADWRIAISEVQRDEPDRSEIVYGIQTDPITGETLPPAWFSGSPEGAVRTFAELDESSVEAMANHRIAFGGAGLPHTLRFGALARWIRRDSDARAYSITSFQLSREEREAPPEAIFDGRHTEGDESVLRLTLLGQGGAYHADETLVAGYAMLDLAWGDNVRVIGGTRIEHANLEVVTEPTIGATTTATPAWTDLLPALAVTIRLGEGQHLRFAASQTLSRPEYRELAPVMYRDVLGGDNVIGNPSLVRTRIRNADVRWEWFPAAGEAISVGVFAKHFEKPIERVHLGTSNTRVVKYVNADHATNVGIELEVRKRLGTLVPALESLTAFSNATFMRSRVTASAMHAVFDGRAMVGQAPWVVNAGVTWAAGTGESSATLLYNVAGPRIVYASEAPLPDILEQPRPTLNAALRLRVATGLALELEAANLLDPRYRVVQGSVVRESYRTGRTLSLGLSWKR